MRQIGTWLAAAACLCGACGPRAVTHDTGGPPSSDRAYVVDRPAYRIRMGDELELTYRVVVEDEAATEYRIRTDDIVVIRFPLDEQYDQRVRVLADGKIRVLLLGPVRAADLTVEELAEQLRAGYGRYIREPELTVDVEPGQTRVRELREALSGAGGGMTRRVLVKPDGTFDAPFAPEVNAVGLTPGDVRRELLGRYAESKLPDLDVSVQVAQVAARRMFVIGEVRRPGPVVSPEPISTLQAISWAGGISKSADLERVVLIRRRGLPLPDSAVVDVREILTAVRMNCEVRRDVLRNDIWMTDGDIVYVPSKSATPAWWAELVGAQQ